jgi:hypothetical protein
MFSFAVLALAAASASAHSISHFRRHHVPRTQPPAGWATSYLEVYDVYHTRYQAIGCENKHNTTFFDFCCHPLLATETVAKNRPACCAVGATAACPGTAPSSAAAPAKTPAKATVVPPAPAKTPAKTTVAPPAPAKTTAAQDDGDEDCDDEDEGDNNDTTGDDDEDCDDEDDNNSNDQDNSDDGEDCDEDEGESTTHAAPTSTKVAPTTSSHAAAPPATSPHTTPTTSSTHTTPKETTTTKETTTAKAATTHTTPTSTPAPTTSASTGDKSSSGSFILGGFGTWFMQNGVAGACGKVHKDSDFVVALETKTYANGINCGRTIQLCDVSNNKCVNGLVADECPTCTNAQSVDMSQGMFTELAALSVGEFKIQWKFVN